MDSSEWITVYEAAQLIGVPPRTITRYRQRGLINAHPWPKDHARRFLYARASVLQFVETYMPPNPDLPPISVLLIDGNDTDRTFFADQLKRRSREYKILEAANGEEGLTFYRSQRIDCVVVAIELPDQSGLKVLVDLVPRASRPNVAVVMLTNRLQRGLGELARQNGAYTCFVKQFMLEDDLDRAIQRAMALVGQIPKEDRFRPL